MAKPDIKTLLRRIEELLNREFRLIPSSVREPFRGPNPAGGGRMAYVPVPGTGSKLELSPRAAQVYHFIKRNRKASARALQGALKVNRNVIAGAIHELKSKGVVRAEPFEPVKSAAGYAPRKRRKVRS